MEKVPETPPRIPVLSDNTNLECKTTPELKQQTNETSRNPGNELRKPTTPDLLKVPKAFKYPERYRSPTDMMVSPITKGLLARARRGGALLPPSKDQLKVQDMLAQEKGLFP
ncbi:uncharacterized protein LOC116207434 [Punica granatum]|uniref:Uncharacterized protein n=2 Tax=Punica granatum TaxID=22663 RepID=A0A218VVW4_PUNGR|nr:uncharacterized protein LOC116207434 [Punica granatum]OWM64526.1 hypothetical protein CDL15_Pgr020493 [Punica granatum]PKI32965.1 hypothetical protein CRG98_046639 [Punica granatum]